MCEPLVRLALPGSLGSLDLSVLFSSGMHLAQLIPSPTLTVPSTKWGRVPKASWTVLPQGGDGFAKQRPSGETVGGVRPYPGARKLARAGSKALRRDCMQGYRVGWVLRSGSAQTRCPHTSRMSAVRGVCSDGYRERLAKAPAPSWLFIVPFRQVTEPVPLLAYFRDLEKKLPAAVWLQGSL